MDLYEIEGKRLMEKFGIPVDQGLLYEEGCCLSAVPIPCVVKAQTLSGKRGKSGGIRIAEEPSHLLPMIELVKMAVIGGKPAEGIYLAPKLDIRREHYLGLTLDRSARGILLMYTPAGGMEIEDLAEAHPESLLSLPLGLSFERGALLAGLARFTLEPETERQVCDIAERLFAMFLALDATTIEINPLAQLGDGSLIAADAKVVLDDNALYRQEDPTILPRQRTEEPRAKQAREAGLAYVELGVGGNIGVIAGGAGIGMATVDTIHYYGGKPFNFLDLGGGTTKEKTYAATRLLLETEQVEGILVNVFGGINNCLTMAEGVCGAIWDTGSNKPLVVKSRGFSQEEGWKLYDALGVRQVHYGTTDDAVRLLMRRMGVRL